MQRTSISGSIFPPDSTMATVFSRPPRSEEHTSELQSHSFFFYCVFFFNDTATTEIYTLSLHDALPISFECSGPAFGDRFFRPTVQWRRFFHGPRKHPKAAPPNLRPHRVPRPASISSPQIPPLPSERNRAVPNRAHDGL